MLAYYHLIDYGERMRSLAEPSREQLLLGVVLHALSDSTRLGIVRSLANGKRRACSEFDTDLAKSSLTHHFRVLRESGVTHTHRDGRTHILTLRVEDLEARFPGLLSTVLMVAEREDAFVS